MDILEKAGVGLPAYYSWSKRSGCYFCPFQSKMTWLNLYENHPEHTFYFKSEKNNYQIYTNMVAPMKEIKQLIMLKE